MGHTAAAVAYQTAAATVCHKGHTHLTLVEARRTAFVAFVLLAVTLAAAADKKTYQY